MGSWGCKISSVDGSLVCWMEQLIAQLVSAVGQLHPPLLNQVADHSAHETRQNYSAMAACNAAKHAAPCSRYEHRIVLTVRARAKPKLIPAAPPAPPVLVLPPALPKVVTETRGGQIYSGPRFVRDGRSIAQNRTEADCELSTVPLRSKLGEIWNHR